LRWCNDAEKNFGSNAPLEAVPPVHFEAGLLDEAGLARFVESDKSGKVPSSSLSYTVSSKNNQLTVPVHIVSDVKKLLKMVFRINSKAPTSINPELQKERTSLAFDALRSLNALTERLESQKNLREDHLDREGVQYSIGQVVQHTYDRWRGVVIGWDRRTKKNDAQEGGEAVTSLTKKDYSSQLAEDQKGQNDIEYTMVIDLGDSHLLGGKRRSNQDTGHPIALQSDLEPVLDETLVRVRSHWIENHFERFDASRNRFIPNDHLTFLYPDVYDATQDDNTHNTTTAINEEILKERQDVETQARQIFVGVVTFAEKLLRCILDETSCPTSRGMDVLASYQERLEAVSKGAMESSENGASSNSSMRRRAVMHLRKILNISLEITEIIWQRRIAEKNKSRIRYSLGDVVQHKKYGFRGVVVAWDHKPSIDVSRWDGLSHIENPNELPFYHIVPDQNDCIQAFGGERPFRYVCDENLEKCPPNRTLLEVDLDSDDWQWDQSKGKYLAPDELKLKYAEDIGDDNTTASCMVSMKEEISKIHMAIRDPSAASDSDLEDDYIHIAKALSLKNLFGLLKGLDCMEDAVVVEENIKEIWKANSDPELRWALDDGIADLLQGNKEKALKTFTQLAEDDPTYAEAWNKISTCHYMLGDMESSLEAAKQTLELQPDHFQALNGLGLVQYETKRYKLAAESFRRSLRLDPWGPVSSRLSACLDLLKAMDNEEGAVEGSAPYET